MLPDEIEIPENLSLAGFIESYALWKTESPPGLGLTHLHDLHIFHRNARTIYVLLLLEKSKVFSVTSFLYSKETNGPILAMQYILENRRPQYCKVAEINNFELVLRKVLTSYWQNKRVFAIVLCWKCLRWHQWNSCVNPVLMWS